MMPKAEHCLMSNIKGGWRFQCKHCGDLYDWIITPEPGVPLGVPFWMIQAVVKGFRQEHEFCEASEAEPV